MRVLVTGGAGYIGSHACKALHGAGHEPVTIDNLRTGHAHAVRWGPFEHGDINDPVRLGEIFAKWQPEAVMHFAALAYVGESVTLPEIYYRTNVGGTLNLLDAMRRSGCRHIVFSSTCATYGVPASLPIREDTPQSPVNPYGWTKLMVEQMLADHQRAHGIDFVALRYFNAAGADPEGELGENHEPETHLIPLVLQAAAGIRPAITVFGTDYPTADGTCIRDYIHVTDLAAAHVLALDHCINRGSEKFNLGNGRGFSVREIIAGVEKVTGRTVPVEYGERRPGDPPTLVADATAARTVLGWNPQFAEPDEMVEHAWNWQLRNHG
ncbi:MAG: UDP-glucose 4-epimerase GalE [Sphingopyxis sp.]|uniref:UDP-glucose 4-epimerase GalE n=1 Tax=Sphingopyxis sp. TaxID=1908224 RepID=UPI003D80F7CE